MYIIFLFKSFIDMIEDRHKKKTYIDINEILTVALNTVYL
jgi:hypothetical protein